MTDDWQPIFATGREQLVTEGFPSWLRTALIPWFRSRLSPHGDYFASQPLIAFQLKTRTHYGFTSDGVFFGRQFIPFLEKLDDKTYTNLLDFLLHWKDSAVSWPLPANEEKVEEPLRAANSEWAVARVGERLRLVQRLPVGVLPVMTEALAGADAATKKLQEAWLDGFGTTPRASVAYYNAVVAVENAAFAVIPVAVPEPTLSTLFSLLEAETPKWKLTLRDSDKAPGGKSLAAMLRSLWRGHDSRHGAKEYEDVSIEQARAAVTLAATLVWWFRSGVVIPA